MGLGLKFVNFVNLARFLYIYYYSKTFSKLIIVPFQFDDPHKSHQMHYR